ncbi:carbonic anhydrase [uncultured Clostridium sp.]|jgi:carbonic anhydrase|uniref:carbonic anhydrase n=1 Tax=uncultured Clostridium sp. TaxID=59620 RepID=UPI002612D09B|nr:carbonic anhydrase [uncultured Clostridium sp.]
MKKIAIGLILISCMGLTACSTPKVTAPNPPAPTPPTVTNSISKNITVDTTVQNSTQAINFLKEGNQRFIKNDSELVNISSERRELLKNGQHPYATLVSCSDSRVTPSLVFNAGLGELFDVRLAGNVVDQDAMGSIEYAVDHLQCPLIVVMGHQNCGAVTAAYNDIIKGEKVKGNIEAIVKEIAPAINANESINDAINKNIANMVNVVKLDPIVKEKMAEGKVDVVGAYYNLDGSVTFMDGK